MNDNIVSQMGAVSAALRMLLATDQQAKPDDLLIAACTGVTDQLLRTMLLHAKERQSTFLLIFRTDDEAALLEKVMIVDASTNQSEINIGGGKFVQKPDGSFAIRSLSQAQPYEYSLTNAGRRLVRRAVNPVADCGVLELQGLQALIAKAGTPECRKEALKLSVHLA